MKRIFTYVWSGALFFALAAGAGCVKQGLDNRKNEGSVEITLNWEGEKPAGSRIHFYPVVEDGTEPAESGEDVAADESVPVYRAVKGTASGWKGKLPVGKYRVIVYNSDDRLELRNEEDYEHAELALALEGSAANAGLPASRVNECICQPDNVMLATKLDEPEDFDGTEYLLEVPFNDVVKVSASPKSILKYVDIDFKIEGDVFLTGGMLTGVSQAVCCQSLVCHTDCYSVQYTPESYSGEESFDYKTRIAVLDVVSPNAGATHMVHLTLHRNDTNSDDYTIAVSVTDQVRRYLAAQRGGKIPVGEALPLTIRLEMIGNVPSVSVDPWDNTGLGSGTIGNTSGSGSAGVQ
ncbi:MAG: DUF5119 domain-containing protein [Alistipes sp.]|nr:DUF5119 domain-containing protein [Alistipes sp.]